MAYMRYEEGYLLALVAAIVNQAKPPAPLRRIDWGSVFRLADFHEVANVAYYGLLGTEEIPQNWRNRFYERYLAYVNRLAPLEKAELLVVEMLEQAGVSAVVLGGSAMREIYPVKEMSSQDEIEILVEEGARRRLRTRLEEMDFGWIQGDDSSGSSSLYYQVPGVRLRIREAFTFSSKEMKRYYRSYLERLPFKEGYSYIRYLPPEEEYIYRICRITERYAKGEIEIRDLMDLWMFLKRNKKALDFLYIEGELAQVVPVVFYKQLLILLELWFGKEEIEAENIDISEAMQSFILTKGEAGQELSRRLLPLLKKVADNYQRNRRRENFQKQVRWVFPEYEYMVNLYPVLETAEILLPACWIMRLVRTAVQWLGSCLNRCIWQPIKASVLKARDWIKKKVRKEP